MEKGIKELLTEARNVVHTDPHYARELITVVSDFLDKKKKVTFIGADTSEDKDKGGGLFAIFKVGSTTSRVWDKLLSETSPTYDIDTLKGCLETLDGVLPSSVKPKLETAKDMAYIFKFIKSLQTKGSKMQPEYTLDNDYRWYGIPGTKEPVDVALVEFVKGKGTMSEDSKTPAGNLLSDHLSSEGWTSETSNNQIIWSNKLSDTGMNLSLAYSAKEEASPKKIEFAVNIDTPILTDLEHYADWKIDSSYGDVADVHDAVVDLFQNKIYNFKQRLGEL